MNEIIDLLTADQLARKLNITVSWIYSHARNKGDNSIPHLKIGKYIRFSVTFEADTLEKEKEVINEMKRRMKILKLRF